MSDRLAFAGVSFVLPADWRRYAPAAGSAFAHVVLLTGLAWALANQVRREQVLRPIPALSVQLVPDLSPVMPAPEVVATPAPAASSGFEALPVAAPKRKAAPVPKPAAREAPSGAPVVVAPLEETLPAAPGPGDVPLGLRSLLNGDTCGAVGQAKHGVCDPLPTQPNGELRVTPDVEALAKMLPGYRPPPPIPIPFYHPNDHASHEAGPVMRAQGAMPMGPGAGTGMESIAGRLGTGGATIDFYNTPPYWATLPPDVKAKVQQERPSLTH